MAASGNRRFLYQPHRTHYFLPALGFPQPRGIQGQLLGSLKEEFPQLQPHPIRAAPWGPPRGTAGAQVSGWVEEHIKDPWSVQARQSGITRPQVPEVEPLFLGTGSWADPIIRETTYGLREA